MEKSCSKKNSKKLPKVLIVEGFWNLGKTKLIDYLAERYNYFIIPEPDHLTENINRNISKWYRQEHGKRHQLAIKQMKQGKNIIMERSVISSLAFDYAKSRTLSLGFKKDLKKINKLRDFLVIFLYGDKDFTKKMGLKLRDPSVKKLIMENSHFCQNYLHFYKKILPLRLDNKIVFIKVNYKNKFKNFAKHYEKWLHLIIWSHF
ncbi:MAG: hypothetical protein UV65_C0020G0005 [Parcubacteria group bacterium GW2011_GWF2_43_11]|nr:MAG: hypothetical protein UV65_C0020G0005 [Parcubacteria group bacterium GW2011_GWF2_43_11]